MSVEQSVEIVKQVVAKVTDLADGEMKEVSVADGKVLLFKEDGQITATSTKCTHYAAPLKTGVFSKGRIRCPWHGACFNTKTGDIEDFPGVDGLEVYPVSIEGDDVVVTTTKAQLKSWKHTKAMCKHVPAESSETIVLVGAGPSSLACAETLRQEGYKGEIIMIGDEDVGAYDRPKLSKAMSSKVDAIFLRQPEFYAQNDIKLITGQKVQEIKGDDRVVILADGTSIKFDYVYLGAGATPRYLNVPGKDLKNIFQLREVKESNAIWAGCENKRVVIIGSSFIGMETASCIAKRASSVSVIGMEKVPFERVLGSQIGTILQKLHERNGIKFFMQRTVSEFIGNAEGEAAGVKLDNGVEIEGDLFVIGAGVIPNTQILNKEEFAEYIARDQSVLTNEFMQVKDRVYAGGDLARFPFWLTGEQVRVEHWGTAQYHGRIVALNILGKKQAFHSVPTFWTTQFAKSIRYCGHATSFDEIIFDGDEAAALEKSEAIKFAAYYVRKGKVLAVLTIGRDPLVASYAEKMALEGLPSVESIVLEQAPASADRAVPDAAAAAAATVVADGEGASNSWCLVL
eukprot:TRINITY_DN4661_c0_g1_i1.p1 TRINITY_DN4661_c0_g1~~TRINITY_DN4661_c0_g1_i1.p1  ORF type:complete len:578 (+),score=300.23 TRINITY_DN4661_c0_g1_i1:22-1734(+)